jgi:hypothetical protein
LRKRRVSACTPALSPIEKPMGERKNDCSRMIATSGTQPMHSAFSRHCVRSGAAHRDAA